MKRIEKLVEFATLLVATKTGLSLNYIQKVLLRESLLEEKKNYAQIAEENQYSESYIKFSVAPKLWQLLSQAIGEKVNKDKFPSLRACTLSDQLSNKPVIKKFSNPVHSFALRHLARWGRLP
jgi:hypothetical protein